MPSPQSVGLAPLPRFLDEKGSGLVVEGQGLVINIHISSKPVEKIDKAWLILGRLGLLNNFNS